MTRILLVSSNQEQRPYPVPPLGLCLLAQRLETGHQVKIFDGIFGKTDELRAAIADFQPDVVGLGIRNIDDLVIQNTREYIDDVVEQFVRPIRESTSAPLILGGSGFSLYASELMTLLGGDYGVVGEAERVLPRLLEALENDGDPGELPGVLTAGRSARDLSDHFTAIRCAPEELAHSRIHRWLDFAPYRARGAYPIQAKRGCDHRCIYCTYPYIEGSTFRLRAPVDVVDELEKARGRVGDVIFEFVDSVFNAPSGFAEAICKEILRRGLQLRLRTMGLNPRGATPELLQLMARAGFVQIGCTPDSASPTVLKQLRKGFTLEQLQATALAIREVDIPTMWFLIFGGPGETEATAAETLDFVDRYVNDDDMAGMWVGLRIYPHTPLHRRALREGLLDGEVSLLRARFYVSPELGRERGIELIDEACAQRPNCVPAWDTTPSPELLREALQLRERLGLTEPMFRTFIRLRRQRMAV